jgi:uncharacterized protein (DUF433 family)
VPGVRLSRPCIRGLRIPVATVVGMVAEGMTAEEILAGNPDLEAEDIAVSISCVPAPPRRRG